MEHALSKIDTTLLDNLIVGRVEPYIYAFSTETVPNYLKVGDTSRGVRVRLDEWRKIFPNLIHKYEHSAQIDNDTIFRDFAVHSFLEQEKKRERLQPNTIANLPYYSREFFKDATTEDVEAAIEDIIYNAREKSGKYPLYSPDRLQKTFTYERTETFPPRDNQQQAIDHFKRAVAAGHSNLLLYAVMRFGKSFTSMCCAKEINARFVVIVSAKADVKEEWKKTVESHKYFEGYRYLDSEDLKRSETIIADTLADQDKKVALFLTLQDLQGEGIKEKHKEVFNRQIELLIVDETHFGARGKSYGKVLQEQKLSKSEIKQELKELDGFETLDRVEEAVKALNTKIRLHLSGTPYRILMSDEFQKDDIIAFVQFTDIIDAQQQWNEQHLKEDDRDEWDNPYYGFPQMIRFAFNPNASSRKKMEQMRKDGISYAFSELFRPSSLTKQADGSHRQFIHESEILDLLEVIDGTKEDENLLGFLDYDKIKNGKMCRHIVCVLPYRASCDAMAELIKKNSDKFKNLGEYEIINITGLDDEQTYKSTDDVKRAIKEAELQDKKTLTLTVNRMLTGTTVPQWDTMLYLKGTASPQEYDQAIFRLQNQYIRTFKDENGKIIKYNMKPQTLLVDFDPNRMFVLQELKSQFYNVNTNEQGNAQLRSRIEKELEVSPIIVLNENKLQKVTPTNITDAVREYSRNRNILDDALEIPADNELLQDESIATILATIEPIDSKKGLQIKPSEGDGDDLEISDDEVSATPNEDPIQHENSTSKQTVENNEIEKRLAAYYARILFFAFLTKSIVKSLEDVIDQIKATEDNKRIAKHLGLREDILKLIQAKSNPFILRKFDYTIENINDLVRDDALEPIERVEIAMRKFGRMSDSEIVTPLNVANDMVKLLPDDVFSHGPVLDIASKQGEFAIALMRRFGINISDKIYSICTSPLAYEFTRKVYDLLSMPVENIFDKFTSYDLIKKDKDKKYIIPPVIKDMNFSAIIGNPPYQDRGGSGGTNDASIYQDFCQVSFEVNPLFTSMVIPSRWFTGGRENLVGNFRQTMLTSSHTSRLIAFTNAKDLFPDAEIKGGCCYFIYNPTYLGKCYYSLIRDGKIFSEHRNLGQFDVLIREPKLAGIVSKIISKSENSIEGMISSDTPFGIPTNPIASTKTPVKIYQDNTVLHNTVLHLITKAGRTTAFVSKNDIKKNTQDIDNPKVFIPEAYGAGESFPHQILGVPELAPANSVCSQSYLYVPFESELEARNFIKYIKTKFLRVLVSASKVSQHAMSKVYRFVPMQDFTEKSDIDWSKSVEEIDAQLYAKYHLTDDEIAFIESMIKPM